MPCLRETAMNVHNLGGVLPVEATASGSLFVKTQIEFVGLTKPTFIVVEMTPVHAHSDNSHTTVARDFFNIGYWSGMKGSKKTNGSSDFDTHIIFKRMVRG